jgi:nucleoside-diphosphate-sugar epimerase
MLDAPAEHIQNQVFNVGGENVQLESLAQYISRETGAEIVSTGNPDKRSYRVSFAKLEALGFKRARSIEDGVAEVARSGPEKTPDTLTLPWYQQIGAFREAARAA